MTLEMRDQDIVERFAEVVGVGTVYPPRPSYSGGLWRWQCNRVEEVRQLVMAFAPYFGQRRLVQAANALAEDGRKTTGRRRPGTSWNAKKNECKNGHPLNGPSSDVRVTKRGWRQCRLCEQDRRLRKAYNNTL
jgi:hypothetical protein